MQVIKKHSDIIIKMLVNQFGIAIFSFFLYTAAGAIKSENGGLTTAIKAAISVFSIAFYFMLTYTVIWEVGAKDKIRIDGNKATREPTKGLILGAVSCVPAFIITLAGVITSGLYLIGLGDGFNTAFGILNLIFRFILMPYLGVIQWISSYINLGTDMVFFIDSVLFLIVPLTSILLSHIAYSFGLKEKRFLFKK